MKAMMPEHPAHHGAAAATLPGSLASHRRGVLVACHVRPFPFTSPGTSAPPRSGAAESTSRLRTRPSAPLERRLDIEHPFGIMHLDKEAG